MTITVSPADGVPGKEVTRGRLTLVDKTAELMVGAVPKTNAPVPVSSVIAEARFALDGVPNAVATPVPRPLTPDVMGSPVALVNTPADGVPRSGVTSVGEVAKTKAPVPVSLVTAEIKLALDGVVRNVATPVPNPLTPVEMGSPVTFVITPAEGVPRSPPLVRIELST